MSTGTTPSRFTKVTKAIRRNLAANGLPADRLDVVRDLATEGARPHTIRRALGLDPREWSALMKPRDDGEPSSLRNALDEGAAAGAGEVIAVMRAAMRSGDTKAAAWLGEKVYRIGTEEGPNEAPRVLIQINAALSPEEYARVIHAKQAP